MVRSLASARPVAPEVDRENRSKGAQPEVPPVEGAGHDADDLAQLATAAQPRRQQGPAPGPGGVLVGPLAGKVGRRRVGPQAVRQGVQDPLRQALVHAVEGGPEPDDEVFFIAAREHIREVTSELREVDKPYHRIMIAGGGNIGATLAKRLEKQYQVKVIERSYDRCRALSDMLEDSIVLHGSGNEPLLLEQENIENTDVFCALTDNDESNIMMSMLAKRLGAKKVITLITNPAYAELVGQEIDIAISPQQITISSLLTHVRKGDISTVHSLRRGAAEALEMTAHGDPKTSKVVGRRLDELDLPPGATVGAILRDEQVIIAHRHIVVEENDHVILFLTDPSKISLVEKLFTVGGSFIT